MRYLILLIFIGISFNELYTQDVYSDFEKNQVLKNDIKLKIQWVHSVQDGKPSTTGYKNLISSFDSNGNLLEETSYRSSGKVTYKRSYKYDTKGNVIEYQNYDGGRNKITYKRLTKYNSTGQKLQEIGFDGVDKFDNRYFYTGGKLTKIKYLISDNLVEQRIIKYTGSEQEIVVYRPEDVMVEKIRKKYDSRGNVLSDEFLSPEGNSIRMTTREYDSEGRVTEESKYYSGVLKRKDIFEYGNNGLSKVYREEPGGGKYIIHEYMYNPAGELISEKWRDGNNKKFSTKTYKYDTKGNFKEIDCYYASYDFQEILKMTYEFY